MKTRQTTLDVDANGGHPVPPRCYVCTESVTEVPLRDQLEARRAMNTAVWILSPGASKRHPAGLVRHSYCHAGSRRWIRWAERQTDERTARLVRIYKEAGYDS